MRASVKTAEIEQALRESKGMIATAARALGINRQTIYNRVAKSEHLLALITDERELVTDMAENGLYRAIREGDVTAIKFYLATQGRARGYVQRTETDLTSDGQRLEFTLHIGDAGDRDQAASE